GIWPIAIPGEIEIAFRRQISIRGDDNARPQMEGGAISREPGKTIVQVAILECRVDECFTVGMQTIKVSLIDDAAAWKFIGAEAVHRDAAATADIERTARVDGYVVRARAIAIRSAPTRRIDLQLAARHAVRRGHIDGRAWRQRHCALLARELDMRG